MKPTREYSLTSIQIALRISSYPIFCKHGRSNIWFSTNLLSHFSLARIKFSKITSPPISFSSTARIHTALFLPLLRAAFLYLKIRVFTRVPLFLRLSAQPSVSRIQESTLSVTISVQSLVFPSPLSPFNAQASELDSREFIDRHQPSTRDTEMEGREDGRHRST